MSEETAPVTTGWLVEGAMGICLSADHAGMTMIHAASSLSAVKCLSNLFILMSFIYKRGLLD
jgi:hypothetical protein